MPLSDPQAEVASCKARFRTVAAGRRLGKTYLAIRLLAEKARIPGQRLFYVAPTYRQAKQIAWKDLKAKLIRFKWVKKINETDLTAVLKNGSEISLRGAENFDSLRGVGLNRLVIDEAADIKQEAWTEVLRPTLADTGGDAVFMGTPKGRNWFYDLFLRGMEGQPEWASFQYHTSQGGRVSADELEAARLELDPLTFEQEFEASFLNFSGRVYYPFQQETHCAQVRQMYQPGKPLDFSFDFNVSPAVACISQELPVDGQTKTVVLGEVFIPKNGNTLAVCRRLLDDWGRHGGMVQLFGDATGGNAGSAKVLGSDWDLVRQELRPVFGDRLLSRVQNRNPAVKARINAVNTRLQAGPDESPIRRLVVDYSCKALIKDLEGVQVLEGGSGEIDKRSNLDLSHISDAIGYRIWTDYPVESKGLTQRKVMGI